MQKAQTKPQNSQISPLLDHDLASLVSDRPLIASLKRLHNGPVHLIFPKAMRKNIANFMDIFIELGLEATIHFAHKANKSLAFLRQAYESGINIDVASKQELIDALATGFTGRRISCTGPKNGGFLALAIQHQCLVAADSITEIKALDVLTKHYSLPINIIIRLNNFELKDRNVGEYVSKFGIAQTELPEAFEFLKSSHNLTLKGFQLHRDDKNSEIKSRYIENLISVTESALEQGFPIEILNIGGGYREMEIADYSEWASYMQGLQSRLARGENTDTWLDGAYGMRLDATSKVAGKDRAEARVKNITDRQLLMECFGSEDIRGRSLAEVVRDYGLSVMVEPGYALVQHAGITLVSVASVKTIANGDHLVVLDADALNFSSQMTEMISDPLLITQTDEPEGKAVPFTGYIVGNLCRETDIIMKRKIHFAATPKAGDILIFANTAGYTSDFEDATPISHPMGKKFVLERQGDTWAVYSEESYVG